MRWYDLDDLEQRDARLIERLVAVTDRVLKPWFRAEVRGLERIPEGAALYVGNHNAGLMTPDTFLFGAAVYHARGLGDVPYGLGHEVAIGLPGINQVIVPLGAVRASHENAHRLFQAGRKVLVYPGGDFDAMRPYRHRDRIVFGGRRGYLKLALREAVPIVPVVAAGAHATFRILDDGRWLARLLRADRLLRIKVWPITLCLPWGLLVGPGLFYLPWPTRILIEALEPIRFERTGPEAAADEAYVRACADRVEGTMQAALTRLARAREALKHK
ncbi:MAG: 1-acyl-sn-glycerol-3-phosphate acyltransferase [Deltaproteobacteria bacterium]|nr:1-acyl-sn-glycerol-3-phosphate acyltransferase [Deltaproteobacteria bacterium]